MIIEILEGGLSSLLGIDSLRPRRDFVLSAVVSTFVATAHRSFSDFLIGIPTPASCRRTVVSSYTSARPTSLTPAFDIEAEYQGLSHWAANSDPFLNPGPDTSDLEIDISDTEPFPDAQLFEPAGQEPVWTPTQIESPDHPEFEDMANDARGPDPLQKDDPWPRSTSVPVPTRAVKPVAVTGELFPPLGIPCVGGAAGAGSPAKKQRNEWSPQNLFPHVAAASSSTAPPSAVPNDLMAQVATLLDTKLAPIISATASGFKEVHSNIEEYKENFDIKIEQVRDQNELLQRKVLSLESELAQIDLDVVKKRFEALETKGTPNFDVEAFKKSMLGDLQTYCDAANAKPKVRIDIPEPPRQQFGSSSSGGQSNQFGFQQERLVARKMSLKGWCPFGSEGTNGLSKDDAKTAAAKMLSLLPDSLTRHLDAEPF